MDTRGKSGYRIKSSMTSHSEKCSPSVKLTVVEEVFADCRGPEKDVLFQQEIQKQLMAQVPTRSAGMVFNAFGTGRVPSTFFYTNETQQSILLKAFIS